MNLSNVVTRLGQSKLITGAMPTSVKDLGTLLRPSASTEEKLEPWQEAWIEQLMGFIFAGMPGMPQLPQNEQTMAIARNQFTGWVKERTVEEARETMMQMKSTAESLLALLPERRVEYPEVPTHTLVSEKDLGEFRRDQRTSGETGDVDRHNRIGQEHASNVPD